MHRFLLVLALLLALTPATTQAAQSDATAAIAAPVRTNECPPRTKTERNELRASLDTLNTNANIQAITGNYGEFNVSITCERITFVFVFNGCTEKVYGRTVAIAKYMLSQQRHLAVASTGVVRISDNQPDDIVAEALQIVAESINAFDQGLLLLSLNCPGSR